MSGTAKPLNALLSASMVVLLSSGSWQLRPPGTAELIADGSLRRRRGQSEPCEQVVVEVEEAADVPDPATVDLEHVQRPRLEAAVAVRLPLGHGRRAVRGGGHAAGAPAGVARAEHPGPDVVPAAQPHLERRHVL